jgi:hypothetical protein
VYAQNKTDTIAIKQKLIQLEKASWDAWKNRDSKFYETFLSDDHVEIGGGGIGNKAEVIATVATPRCNVKSYTADKFQFILFNSNSALLTYYATQETMCGTYKVPSPVWVSSLYIKRGNTWLNAAYQQTPVSN